MSPWVERVAAADPAHRKPAPAQGAVLDDGLRGVGAAGGGEAAVLPEQRADPPPVAANQREQQPCERAHRPLRAVTSAAGAVRRGARA